MLDSGHQIHKADMPVNNKAQALLIFKVFSVYSSVFYQFYLYSFSGVFLRWTQQIQYSSSLNMVCLNKEHMKATLFVLLWRLWSEQNLKVSSSFTPEKLLFFHTWLMIFWDLKGCRKIILITGSLWFWVSTAVKLDITENLAVLYVVAFGIWLNFWICW